MANYLDELRKQYDVVERYDDDFIRVGKDGCFGIVDKFNNIIIPLEYDERILPVGSAFEVYKNGKQGLIRNDGKIILECEYDYISNVRGWYAVKKENVPGVVKFDAGLKQEMLFKDVEDMSSSGTYPKREDNLFCVKKNGKWGYVNDKGVEIIPCEYDGFSISDIQEEVKCIIDILNSGGFDYMDEEIVQEYANDKNFYKVLINSLINRLNVAFDSKSKKTVDDFIEKAGYTTHMIIQSIKNLKTESKISEKGLGVLQEFYDKNLKVDKLKR